MNDVKIVVAGIEMTPEQARKVHAELSKLFAPAIPQLTQPVTPQPGLRETDFGRCLDGAYMATSALQKLEGGC